MPKPQLKVDYSPVLSGAQRDQVLSMIAHLVGPRDLLAFMGLNKLKSSMIRAGKDDTLLLFARDVLRAVEECAEDNIPPTREAILAGMAYRWDGQANELFDQLMSNSYAGVKNEDIISSHSHWLVDYIQRERIRLFAYSAVDIYNEYVQHAENPDDLYSLMSSALMEATPFKHSAVVNTSMMARFEAYVENTLKSRADMK